jgi:signal transduction histidine kinase
MAVSFCFSAFYQHRFAKFAPDRKQGLFHRIVFSVLLAGSLLFVARLAQPAAVPHVLTTTILSFLPVLPFAALIYYVQRFNFLQIGRQQNLLYAVSATFLALLYLSLVRRLGLWLEPILPPEATAAVLLFVLVIFVEPIQRALGRRLHQTAQREMERVRRLTSDIRERAREGNLRDLVSHIGLRVRDQFEFEDAWLEVPEPGETVRTNSERAPAEGFSVYQPGLPNAVLFVRPHGAMLSGEIRAALELFCEQIPASIDLCRLIGEKLSLERELAERERLAALGQMAASISHNLKNPLGSIKMILQVQLESPEMPDSLKSETQMVLAEISRLSNKLTQLLQFSRPAVLGEPGFSCDVADVVKDVTEVLRHEAERKGLQLDVSSDGILPVAAGREAVSDILSNLIVNALDAAAATGNVRVTALKENDSAIVHVEDDGQGIPSELREKVLQPFFTTKTQGTGLGLAIVAKRIAEANGTLEIASPIANGRGTRFSARLPLREEGK